MHKLPVDLKKAINSTPAALNVTQYGTGDLLALKNHLPGATTLAVKTSLNELSSIIVPKSSLEIRQKSGVTWSAKTAWNAVDVGDWASPAFADLDNDGDLDMLIGNTDGISYAYENTGTASSPVWTAKTAWNTADVGNQASPAFADLDNDGDYDLLIGDNSGVSFGYENTGTASSPVWTAKTAWNASDVGTLSNPAFADLDNDGDYDLLIGEQNGVAFGYENTGTASSPTWAAKASWNTADVGDLTSPAFADLDNDGDMDLLIGEFTGPSYGYENTGTTMSTFFAKTGNVGIGTSTPAALLHVNAGTTATTVVEVGDQFATGVSGSKGCFNTKNAAGAVMSYYFNAANAMVVESNRCR